ncbi:MAG: alpha/beta hydrolase [Nitrospinae bacterium]|nr:alpha/beta hydrolase [Nitrospinota bacterium]
MTKENRDGINFLTKQNGDGVYYRSAGEGKPIIFIHGWCMNSLVWAWQIAHFSKTNLAIAIDLRGHGLSQDAAGPYTIDSMADDLNLLVETLGVKSPIIVGWSMGTMVALNYIANFKNDIAGIVLVGGTLSFLRAAEFPHGRHPAMVKRLSENMERDYKNYIPLFCRGFFETKEKIGLEEEEAISELLLNNLFPPPFEVAKETLKELCDWRIPEKLSALRIPALMIHGEVDNIASVESALELHRIIPESELKVFEKSGHAPFLTDCDKFNQELGNFIVTIKGKLQPPC